MTTDHNGCDSVNPDEARPMRLDAALTQISQLFKGPTESEVIPLAQALNRVLAKNLVSEIAVPPFDNSAVDGWAVRGADLLPEGKVCLPVGGRIVAGRPLAEEVLPRRAYRIFTGAPLPTGLDTVLMQEDCRETEGGVLLPAATPGANLRKIGDSVAVGDVALVAGTILKAQHLGVAASLGLASLQVYRRARVAIFSTGNELREPGEFLPEGCLYDSNRPALAALITRLGCVVRDLGIVRDRPELVRDALTEAAANHDLIITSGGVSVGEEDHVKAAVQAQGKLDLWRLAIKPGKPLALGRIGEAVFLGLPGNPVAVMVTFLLLARPLIARLSGATMETPRRWMLPAGFSLKKKAGRREFPRARLVDAANGPRVELFRPDSSAVLTSMVAADGLVDLPEAAMDIHPGDLVAFLPFSEVMS
ncbi:MAG TPA: molybdopterin molybdotransferase MoeA [Rhodospirillaceae bacterium]|nr:molybdopterin molybdotransferase MoeA [Rhodospirillaceae bacterium]